MSTDTKLSKAQTSRIIRSRIFWFFVLGNLGKLTNFTIPPARGNLHGLVSNLTASTIQEFDRKRSGKGGVKAGKGFTLFTSNEDIHDIVKIIEPLEDLKREMKKQEGGFLGTLLALLAALIV